MDNKPKALTKDEIREIAAIEDIQQMWGAQDAAEMEKMLDTTVYAVKFDYQSVMGPGYIGDYFILQGDALGEAIELIRSKERTLTIVDARTL
jgi:hypothetical protein